MSNLLITLNAKSKSSSFEIKAEKTLHSLISMMATSDTKYDFIFSLRFSKFDFFLISTLNYIYRKHSRIQTCLCQYQIFHL